MIKRSIIFPFRDTRMIRRAFSFFAYFWPKLALLRCVVGWFIHFEQQKKKYSNGPSQQQQQQTKWFRSYRMCANFFEKIFLWKFLNCFLEKQFNLIDWFY